MKIKKRTLLEVSSSLKLDLCYITNDLDNRINKSIQQLGREHNIKIQLHNLSKIIMY